VLVTKRDREEGTYLAEKLAEAPESVIFLRIYGPHLR